jgi:5-methylcytosine-specific restriction protein B
MHQLHPKIEAELRSLETSLAADGTLLSRAELQRNYDIFRREFGPEVLRSLEGEQLLERMHATGSRDSLSYWLEFKNDESFRGYSFGSISGGSALKFGVYRRAESGSWATKGTGPAPRDILLGEAVEIARRHRDQILAAVDLVSRIPDGADDAAYIALQRDLERVAPNVHDTAWGHKYLSLLFPNVLDDFHVADYQRYNLIRLLQLPPRAADEWIAGRYVCAGRFVALARILDVPLHAATTLLNHRHGSPRGYWRLGTTDEERVRRKYWAMMRDGDVIAVGWQKIGDLSGYSYNEESRKAVAAMVEQHHPTTPQGVGRSATQLLTFVARIAEGDRVIAADGQTALGIAEVIGPYSYNAAAGFPHQRPVRWLSVAEWKTVDAESLRTSVGTIKDPRNQVEIERRILDDKARVPVPASLPTVPVVTPGPAVSSASPVRGSLRRLTGVPGMVQSVLERKGQAILYGPPGTGKTHWAVRTARDLAALRAFDSHFETLSTAQRTFLVEGTSSQPALVRVTSFHPEYGYEDFIEGYRPRTAPDGSLAFALLPGTFKKLCTDASAAPEYDFYLVIDEINRGDVPRIFGELLTLLERDKRGQGMLLPVSGETFRVPPNVYVLGTMNTADRSIALLDVALRRRFGFVELMPDYGVLQGTSIAGLSLQSWLSALNKRIRELGGGDSRNRQIGHAFFLSAAGPIASTDQFAAVMRDDIVPLLEEYCYDDFGKLAELLGKGLVDLNAQRIRRELFEAGRAKDLIDALWSQDVSTDDAAVMTGSEPTTEPGDDDADDTTPTFDSLTERDAQPSTPEPAS